MRFVAALIIALAAVSCGGGSSTPSEIPQADACKQGSQAACAKLLSCKDDPILTNATAVVGTTAAACESYIQASYCPVFACAAGQTYHGDKAKQCKDQVGALTCSALSATVLSVVLGGTLDLAKVLATVPGCQEICTGGADASSGG